MAAISASLIRALVMFQMCSGSLSFSFYVVVTVGTPTVTVVTVAGG